MEEDNYSSIIHNNIIIRIITFGIIKSFFEAKKSYYQALKRKLKKEE